LTCSLSDDQDAEFIPLSMMIMMEMLEAAVVVVVVAGLFAWVARARARVSE